MELPFLVREFGLGHIEFRSLPDSSILWLYSKFGHELPHAQFSDPNFSTADWLFNRIQEYL
jgi:hypothetical protein